MDFDTLWTVAERARAGQRLPTEDIAFVREVVPRELASFPNLDLPTRIQHPAGFVISGTPVGTFLRSALLIAAQKALGSRFGGAPFYEDVERDLAFGIMRSHFHHGYPKGTHCCVQCTLAVYPVLEARAIRYFDCWELARDVKELITKGEWRFVSPPNAKMLSWALRNKPSYTLGGAAGGVTKREMRMSNAPKDRGETWKIPSGSKVDRERVERREQAKESRKSEGESTGKVRRDELPNRGRTPKERGGLP